MSLNKDQIALIKASIPVLQNEDATLAKTFYSTMIAENPQLRDIFNSAHQNSAAQPKALTHALLMYATYIEDLPKLQAMVARIVAKHVSLQIPKEGYPIVGKYLLRTLGELLGPEVVNSGFLEAWRLAYESLANLLMSLEQTAYHRDAEAGWPGYQRFKVVSKIKENNEVVSICLEPVKATTFITPTAGQYLGFKFVIDGRTQCREYSISGVDETRKQFRISIKRVLGGIVSNYIHDSVELGDCLLVVAPQGHEQLPEVAVGRETNSVNAPTPVTAKRKSKAYGFDHGFAITYQTGITKLQDIYYGLMHIAIGSTQFHGMASSDFLRKPARIMLLAAGIGITPFVTMTNAAIKQGAAVHLVQCDKTVDTALFVAYFDKLQLQHRDQLLVDRVFSQKGLDNTPAARLDKLKLSQLFSKSKPTHLYVVGPNEFMANVKDYVSELPDCSLISAFYHFFGPSNVE